MIRHFIIGGAQRSATTYLSTALSAHPEILMAKPARPEPKFFLKPELYEQGLAAYHDMFFKNPPESVTLYGEKSTSYYESVDAAKRMKAMLPDAKHIFMLRNPIDRALSNISFSRMHGFEDQSSDIAIMREVDAPETMMGAGAAGTSVSPQAYLARGCYADCLAPFAEVLGRENIHVALTENVIGSLAQIQAIFRFLDIDDTFQPSMLDDKINPSKKTAKDQLSLTTRARLDDYFAAKNEALTALFDLDLSAWT